MTKTTPSIGLSTITAIVAALAAGIPAVLELLDGVKTVEQAVVICFALAAATILLAAMILSRGRQAIANAQMTNRYGRTGE